MSTTIRAKFEVTSIERFSWNENQILIKMQPRYDEAIPENRRFEEATPSGNLDMHVSNPAAIEVFKLGKTFYLDFTPVDESAD